jgi:hypothetical protein
MSAPFDWDAIELDYRAGVLPLRDICKKHGVSMRQLQSTAAVRGWTRALREGEITEAEVMGAVTVYQPDPRAEARFPQDSIYSEDDLRAAALLSAAAVVKTHRDDVRRLRESSAAFATVLEKFIRGEPLTANEAITLTSEKTPTDLLEKLSRVMLRTVAIERQSYGLSALEAPEGEEGDSATRRVQDELDEIKRVLFEVTAEKRKDGHQQAEPVAAQSPGAEPGRTEGRPDDEGEVGEGGAPEPAGA